MRNTIEPELNAFVGRAFERIARNALLKLNSNGKLPAYFERFGPWWSGDSEMDIVGVNNKTKDLLLCEVKWADLDGREVERIAAGLKEKAKLVGWQNKARKEHYCIIAKRIKGKPKTAVTLLELKDIL